MKVIRLALGSILFVALFATGSMAQTNARTFVSGAGLDTNPCSVSSPCRTFGQAISQTIPGGEVIVLTSAGYGPFTINKTVALEAPAGVYAGITATSGNGIEISIGTTDTVILRGLTINTQGGIGNGISFTNGGTLHIESCTINGFIHGNGIHSQTSGYLFVKDTIARGNNVGIALLGNTGNSAVTLDHVSLDENGDGLDVFALAAGAVVQAAIRNSSLSGNFSNGAGVAGISGGIALLDIESCLIVNDSVAGVDSSGGGVASLSNCTIDDDGSAFTIETGGTIYTRQNNTMFGSTTGTLTPFTAK
jgi:hypothetical protein